MFSLIITIIAIALVAALALATLYYGGSALNKGSDAAAATRVLTQGQQITGAMDLYRADFGVWPSSMEELVEKKYLQEIPGSVAATSSVVPNAFAADTWTIPTPGVPVVVYAENGVNEAVCKEVNRKAIGHDGILRQAYQSFATQCYGSALNQLTVVITRDPSLLSQALAPADVAAVVPPAVGDTTSPLWLVAPGTATTTPPVEPPVNASNLRFDFSSQLPFGGDNTEQYVTIVGPSLRATGPVPTFSASVPSGLTATYTHDLCEPLSETEGVCYGIVRIVPTTTLPAGTVLKGTVTFTGVDGVATRPVTFATAGAPPFWVMQLSGSTITIRSNYLDPVAGASAFMGFAGVYDSDFIAQSRNPMFAPNRVTYEFADPSNSITSVVVGGGTRVSVDGQLFGDSGNFLGGLFTVPNETNCYAYTLLGPEPISCAGFDQLPLHTK